MARTASPASPRPPMPGTPHPAEGRSAARVAAPAVARNRQCPAPALRAYARLDPATVLRLLRT